ncbi:MAG: Gx transporter family protein [Lachnospiraceae bacterium]|nr:Gx transporter family protein [Lachnospiraceae bacterium]
MSSRGELVARGAVMTSLALILSYVESQIPYFFGLPGMKLGLTNVLIVYALYAWNGRWALGINILRIFLSGILFGSPFGILYSLSGGILSFLVMVRLKKTGIFSVSGGSIAGGIAHNTGQLLLALVLVENVNIFYYAPFLILSGALTGFVIGLTAGMVLKRLPGESKLT